MSTTRRPAPRARRSGHAAIVGVVLTLAGCTVAGSPLPATPTASSTIPATARAPETATSPTAGHSSSATSGTSNPGNPGSTGTALAALATLPVKGRAPATGYRRAQFGEAWTDDVRVPSGHNGCDQRSDILRRDLQDEDIKPDTAGCVPAAGTLHDPYTQQVIAFVRGPTTSPLVQIDHVVALSNAWQTGAQLLSTDDRADLAGDPLNLLAVDGPTNQQKGAGDAATWLPPNKAFRCTYVSRQVAVKQKYRLWLTPPERAAIKRVLATCPAQHLPTDGDPDVGVPAPKR